jgi:hypothetical protein
VRGILNFTKYQEETLIYDLIIDNVKVSGVVNSFQRDLPPLAKSQINQQINDQEYNGDRMLLSVDSGLQSGKHVGEATVTGSFSGGFGAKHGVGAVLPYTVIAQLFGPGKQEELKPGDLIQVQWDFFE